MTRQYHTTTSSRERNRVHAQKTRQRKKEQMNTLKNQAWELKEEQLRLRQTINDKATATILVCLFAEQGPCSKNAILATGTQSLLEEDPAVEELLRRPCEEIPDSTKIPELPALILPGQHASKKMRANRIALDVPSKENPAEHLVHQRCCTSATGGTSIDDIDYELLGRDRSQCTPAELDLIRRERNRMHAKRTRDRKRLYTEQLGQVCRQLQDENHLLHEHLRKLDPLHVVPPPPGGAASYAATVSTQSSPKMGPSSRDSPSDLSTISLLLHPETVAMEPSTVQLLFDQQVTTLLMAAASSLNEISDTALECDFSEPRPAKRSRF
jgi:bZIP transcription factor